MTQAAWAAGGRFGYRRAWIGDVLRFGVVGCTSHKLWGPLDKDGSGLLAPGQEPYSVIGESCLSLKLWEQVLTGGRFLVNQPQINATDNRMTPITYSGGSPAACHEHVAHRFAQGEPPADVHRHAFFCRDAPTVAAGVEGRVRP